MNKIIFIFLLPIVLLGFEIIYDLSPVYGAFSNILKAEYYIDDDPGEGQGEELEAVDGDFDSLSEQIFKPIDTSGLTIGVHNLYIRMQNEELLWGTPRKIPFEVTGDKNISMAEYFVDTPCEGIPTSMTPGDGAFDQLKETALANVDTSDLSFGIHTIYVRMKDAEDHWGTCTPYKFEVREPPYIAAAEYFIDVDPGLGNGAILPCEDEDYPFDSPNENLEETFRAWCYSVGSHTLFVRTIDSYSRWSDLYSVPIYIDNAPIDVCEGDATGDGVTNILDKVQVRNHFGESSDIGWWLNADLNCDGVVNILDKVIVRNDFGCSQD